MVRVVSSDHRRTSEQDDEKEAGIKSAVANSGDSEERNGEKGDGIDSEKKKKLLVIPLRGIFVHRAHRRWPETIPKNRRPDFRYGNFLVYMRPYCVEFLKFCFERFNVGLWSAARAHNLQGILTNVLGDLKEKLLFTWDQEHCTDSGFMCLEKKDKPLFLKELDHIWQKKYPNLPWSDGEYSASNTLLITYPAKAILNLPNTAIFPPSYDPENKQDDLLGPNGELRVFLAGLAEAEDVQTYVKNHPIGDPEITPSHPDWEHYYKILCSINKKKIGDQSQKVSDEEEETPQKQQSGKKRSNESAIKTSANEKKAKLSTPQKTDGKKGGWNVATPYPSKQGKTPANKPSQASPASASDGEFSCKSCNRSFKSDMALQSHKAKHKY